MESINRISVIGLGKLGGSMAAAFASCGFDVIGVDVNPAVVRAFNEGKAPVQETGLEELIYANTARLHATVDTQKAVLETDISFVIVPTPSDQKGAFSLRYAIDAFAELGRALKEKRSYHVIVMTSTVLPGSVRNVLLPILEQESGLRCGHDFGLCYNPEFIALGSVIRDFLNPDFYLLGQFDKRSGDWLESVHQRVSQNCAPVKRMTLENAELAKIAVNSFVTLKISFANMLAEFCEHIPDGDVDVVSDALGMDKRIGRKYLTGGLGFAGPCFPRDNAALAFLGQYLGVDSDLLKANDEYNSRISNRLMARLHRLIPSEGTVAILGLSYKPLSHIVDASSGVALAKRFVAAGYRVQAHDCLAVDEARSIIGPHALLTTSLDQALAGADIVLVTTTDAPYLKLSASEIVNKNRRVILVDFWRCLGHLKSVDNIHYIPGGRCVENDLASDRLSKLWS
ncbi:MAG: nucleotide sugar dehydrogenase [Leptolyngbyaceae bacterium]|nr:nucleotide sugar dehydrogenase [Leptolyngbyaceae bacterium]